ncbi:LamG domain-containing protein [Micromonospora sp. L32]|uniref:LamG domain-containing protein n=1 Tax=Micromonospora sp. L32 TaxID=3452214 RepID=UPI003F8C83B4
MTVLLTAVAGGGSIVSAVPAVASAPVAGHLLEPGVVGDSPETVALTAADRLGRPVEVAHSKTESSRVLATPQGSLLLESYPVPRWIDRHGSGWRQVDTTLESTESGVVAPIATFADSQFSPGGAEPLVQLPLEGGLVKISWPAPLPTPTLEGDTAVYASVLPDVDLRVRALVDGFTWVVVVKSAQAAKNPALESLRLQMETPGLTRRARVGGGFDVVDAAGKSLLSAGNALMWDSPGTPEPGAGLAGKSTVATTSSDGDSDVLFTAPDLAKPVELPTEVVGADLVIRPNLSLLRGADTVYPVVIDPWTSINKSMWGYAGSQNATRDDGVARVGLDPTGVAGVFRSFFRFNLSGVGGKNIRSAKFLTEMTHSWSCTSTPVNLWRTADLTTSGKQSWDGPNLEKWLEERSGHAHKPPAAPSCGDDPQPDMPMEFSSQNLKTDIDAHKGQANYTLALAARQSDGSSESTKEWWKKFDPALTKLTVEYNTDPNTPTAGQLTTHATYEGPGEACVIGANRPMIRGDYPWLKAILTDLDGSNGGKLSGVFNLQKWTGSAWAPVSGWPRTVAGVSPNAKAEIKFGPIADGEQYRWQVQTKDTLGGASLQSPWCELYADYSPPAFRPKVTAADGLYLESVPVGTNDSPRGAKGLSGQFTFSANGAPDVYDYVYWLGQSGPQRVAKAPSLGGSVTVWVTPTERLDNTLFVRSRDQAGNQSAIYEYVFLAGDPTAPTAVWGMDEGSGTAQATTPAGGPVINLYNNPQWSDGWVTGTHKTKGRQRAVSFGYGKGWGATTTKPPIDSSHSFSVSAWARVWSTNTFGSVVAASGSNNGAWQLQRDKGGSWYFHTFSADSPTHTRTSVAASPPAAVNVWQHITGVYDAGLGEIRIYVNGVEAGKQPLSSLWSSTGVMQIGRVHYNGVQSNYFEGEIDDVRLWDRVIDPDEDLEPILKPVLVGEWDMEDPNNPAPRQQADTSGYNRPVTLSEPATAADFCADGYNFTTGLCLDGTSGTADTAGQVLRTEGSWTVMARVKPSAFTAYHTVLSQCGTARCAFYLQRQNNAPASWAIVVPDKDASTGVVYTTVKWGGTPTLNQWVHLAATYDSAQRKLDLYINGAPAGVVENVPPAWPSTGRLRIGSSDSGDHFKGVIDDVQVWQGALDPSLINSLANS